MEMTREVSLEDARQLQQQGAEILWRPEGRNVALVLIEPDKPELVN